MMMTWQLRLSHHFTLLSNHPLQGLQRSFQQLKQMHNALWMHTGLWHQRSHLTIKLRLTSISSSSSSAVQLHFGSLIVGFLLNFWPACKHCCYCLVQTGSFLNARLPSYACPDCTAFFIKHILQNEKLRMQKGMKEDGQLLIQQLCTMQIFCET
jgi:hypothetical protein